MLDAISGSAYGEFMNYEQSWLKFKRLRTLWLFVFFGYGAIVIALGILLSRYIPSER
jgi:hypothetical protein